jgi:hypothetical protein
VKRAEAQSLIQNEGKAKLAILLLPMQPERTGTSMSTETNPFDAIRTIMLDNLGKVESATKNYLDLVQKTMLSVPNANETQVTAFRSYLDRQLAANQAFASKLVGAKDLQEAVKIQVEYFQSQMQTAVTDAMKLGEHIAESSKRAAG